jgi:hypothetical protein
MLFVKPDRGSAQSARSRLTDVIGVDRNAAVTSTAGATAEIATLRQKLAAAEARIRERGRHNTTEAHKDKIKSVPILDDTWLHFCAT